ncbi:MAG: D-alanyl-D-alanine carboxypeptidase family protein [Cyanobacteriota bacterium]
MLSVAPRVIGTQGSGRVRPQGSGQALQRRSSSPEDIPVARRMLPSGLSGRRPRSRLFGIGLIGLVSLGGLVLAFPGPLRRLLAPPPVPGLQARLSADGRLLGHFPYQEVPASDRVAIGAGLELQRDAAEALNSMLQAAANDGIHLRVLSAFRSVALQKSLFFDVKSERNQSAEERARVSAPPGFSEHSTGLAVDLGDGSAPGTDLSKSFETTPAYHWLLSNAARHHFQLSFPEHNAQGVSYEPWHWRFEGSAEALRQFEAAHRLAATHGR